MSETRKASYDPVRNLCTRLRIETQMADNSGEQRPEAWILVRRIEVLSGLIKALSQTDESITEEQRKLIEDLSNE